MKPKLRTIVTTKRVGSVPRKDIRAAVRAVAAARSPEMQRLVRGEGRPEKHMGTAGK